MSAPHNIPPPRPGWRWLVNETTHANDCFQKADGRRTRCMGLNQNYHTDGPHIWHSAGDLFFTVSGYIRRLPKKKVSP